MTGFLGSVLFVFGSLFVYGAVIGEAWVFGALATACALAGLWLCRRSGVF